jgi:AraC family transcriptional regulator
MTPIIKVIEAKKLVGISESMNLIENKTAMLWQNFMPKRHLIKNINGNHFISMQIYDNEYFAKFNPDNKFTKWACTEVTDFETIPFGMQTIILPAGKYAIFKYKGLATQAAPFFEYIFTQWLPNSNYELDNRPHFEVLGEKYHPNNPQSEEEVWIPIEDKQVF